MTLKDELVRLFEDNRGAYLSGELMARQLRVTRAAVWKAIQALRSEGYEIDAVPNRGYRLSERTDVLSAAGIKRFLPAGLQRLELEVFQSVSSTNSLLRERAEAGAREDTVLIAARQSAGRGRMGRSFYSPADTGLYLSLLLRPALAADSAARITTLAAVAVCRAVEEISGQKAGIKWVNDVFLDGKKIGGILTEAAFSMESGRLDYAILGVGVNVYAPEGGFPPELRDIAGHVLDERRDDAKNRLAAAFLSAFYELYADLPAGGYIEEYRRRSLVIGQGVTVLSGDHSEPALVLGIDDDCRLLVRYEDGREAALSSGEIRIKL